MRNKITFSLSILKAIVFVMFILSFITISSHAQEIKNEQKSPVMPSGESFKNAKITYQLIPANNNTWGYNIFVENKILIHQPSIPGLSGNEGFKTKEGAKKVAELVVGKLKKGEMPPSISLEEMKNIKAI